MAFCARSVSPTREGLAFSRAATARPDAAGGRSSSSHGADRFEDDRDLLPREVCSPVAAVRLRRRSSRRRFGQDPRAADRAESQRVTGLLAADAAFRGRRPHPGHGRFFRGSRTNAVTGTTARSFRRAWWKYLLILAGAGIVCILAALWYTTTESFQGLVRRRLVE